MLRKTEDIAHKVEGCQDLVQLSPPLPSVSAAMASSTGLTLPVALVATGAVVGTGATTAMTAPVATRATPRPSTRRVWRAYVHDHPHRARRPSRARCPRPRRAPASAAPTTRLCTGIHAHPVNTPESARPVRAAARACVCSLRVRTHAAAGHASAAHCCRTLPGPAGLRPAAASCGESPAAASMARREPGSCERARTRWWCVSRCRQLRAWPCGTARCRAPPVCVSAKFKN